MNEHVYEASLAWSGDPDATAVTYESYSRDFVVHVAGKAPLLGSAAPLFRGDGSRHDPEDWLLAALAGCHMLAYLALCARRGIVVLAYEDRADAMLALDERGGGRFASAVLRPVVTVASESQITLARELHARAHERCFIASSVSFPVTMHPTIRAASAPPAAHAGALQ